MTKSRKLAAYTFPMALFLAFLVLNSALKGLGGSFWLNSAEYWIYPAQTILCGAVALYFWREYALARPARLVFGLAIAIVVFFLWIAPQAFFGAGARETGFNPDLFAAQPVLYWTTVILRFLRLALVVPLVEEIFWRGFMLRFLIDENFDRVLFGTFSWISFAVVALVFGFSHTRADWPAAIVTGMLYNLVAYRTKSLSTCVLTHALTNLLLGFWIMKTGQWGFW
jgi:CAAX prenyl protease-like protein